MTNRPPLPPRASMPSPTRRASDLLAGLLDKGYVQAVNPLLKALARDFGPGSLLDRRFKDFQAYAAKVAAAGGKIDMNAAEVKALLSDFERVMRQQAVRIDAVGIDALNSAVTSADKLAGAFVWPVMSPNQLSAVGWNKPDPAAIARIVDYTNKAAWQNMINAYGPDMASRVQAFILKGIADGRGPIAIARDVRKLSESLPKYAAESIVRTLQLQGYRDATQLHYLANQQILAYQIRVEALDDRTCPSCIALNGQHMDIGERVTDHYKGRATSVVVVKGYDAPNVPNGEDWLRSRPVDVQKSILGNAAYEAWQNGDVQLSDFAGTYHDPVFGEMTRTKPMKEVA